MSVTTFTIIAAFFATPMFPPVAGRDGVIWD
jgi:hypothetical protein